MSRFSRRPHSAMPDVITRWFRSAYDAQLARFALPLDANDYAADAVVFAPHPDDETLGCGGTIALKRARGANVHVVIMTDGAASHAQFIAPDQMRAVRQKEALNALGELSIGPHQVHFLGFPDGQLRRHFAAAQPRVLELLRQLKPDQVFIPYRHEQPDDHLATHEIVTAVIATAPRPTKVFEYPVWYWDHWPLVSRRGLRRKLRSLWAVSFSCSGLRDLRRCSDVRSVLPQKRRALDAYLSQMTRLNGEAAWPTLPDIAAGQFLNRFLTGDEYFYESIAESDSSPNEG